MYEEVDFLWDGAHHGRTLLGSLNRAQGGWCNEPTPLSSGLARRCPINAYHNKLYNKAFAGA